MLLVRGEIDLRVWGARACFPDKTGLKSAERRAGATPMSGGGAGGPPQKILKNKKHVFQAFQALSSHIEGMGNSKESYFESASS